MTPTRVAIATAPPTLIASGLIALALIATPAAAQRALNPKPLVAVKPESQPAALPGATGSAAAERAVPGLELKPNEALFDAVNRGDMAATRDAINRGADLNARNLLGLTAIELSVDLGRNPITFFLLSVRAGSETLAPPPSPLAAATPKRTVTAQATPAPKPVPVAAAQTAPRPPAGDPGTPAPQQGFLGFSASR